MPRDRWELLGWFIGCLLAAAIFLGIKAVIG
jgi:hypothetical protein